MSSSILQDKYGRLIVRQKTYHPTNEAGIVGNLPMKTSTNESYGKISMNCNPMN